MKGSKKGTSGANIRSPIYPEMGSYTGRGIKEKRSGHMTWGSNRKRGGR